MTTSSGARSVRVRTADVTVAASITGSGPATLLLHGYPETQRMWAEIAPQLAAERTLITTDLRGYGESDRPDDDPEHITYSKRAMAADQIAVMDQLGFETFDVVGHDRGGRVAHRLALDHLERVRSVAVLDIVPTLHMFDHVDRAMAESYFHWFFLTRPAPLPERLIAGDLEAWMRSRFDGRCVREPAVSAESFDHYLAAMAAPGGVAATCADYRAAATIDLTHDRADRDAGALVETPLLALWGKHSYVGRTFDVVDAWRQYAVDVAGLGIESDHYIAEEAPAETAVALRSFWAERSAR